jgi:hypothetical protein
MARPQQYYLCLALHCTPQEKKNFFSPSAKPFTEVYPTLITIRWFVLALSLQKNINVRAKVKIALSVKVRVQYARARYDSSHRINVTK